MRIKLSQGIRTNTGPTGFAAEGDVVEMKAIHCHDLINAGAAEETTDPVETAKAKGERLKKEHGAKIAEDEEKLAADKAAQPQ